MYVQQLNRRYTTLALRHTPKYHAFTRLSARDISLHHYIAT